MCGNSLKKFLNRIHTILTTPPLYFRPFTLADAPLILALNGDIEILNYVHELPLQNLDDAIKVIEERILPQYTNNLGR
jgi:hypothetical protein